MAGVFLTYAMEEVLRKAVSSAANQVGSAIVDDVSLAWRFDKEVAELQHLLETIRDSLQEEWNEEPKSLAARKWLQRIKDIAYDVEDLLDDVVYKRLRQKVGFQSDREGNLCNFSMELQNKVRCFFTNIVFRHVMADKIRKINKRLDGIKSGAAGLELAINMAFPPENKKLEIPQTHSFLNNSQVIVGRDKEVSRIVNSLVDLSRKDQPISVVSLVGSAGLGKTTLAKKVLRKIKEQSVFDVTMWVCVSQDFNEQKILKGMLESASRSPSPFEQKDPIVRNLRDELRTKKFLLVLDDVWNIDEHKWNSLKNELSVCNEDKGNCVFVTTRDRGVAKIMGSKKFRPRRLKNDECWEIIRERAVGKKQRISPDREDTGRKIAIMCRGLPLVAEVLGALMSREEDWSSIQKSKALESDEIRSKLKLSFDRLRNASLKQCFLYYAIFREDFEFGKEDLVQQWISQRYFKEEEGKTMEEIGNEHFDFLLASSLFQYVREHWIESTKIYKMHDEVHALARYLLGFEKWIDGNESIDDISSVWLLNISNSNHQKKVTEAVKNGSLERLRVLFSETTNVFENVTWNFESLRALKIRARTVITLPETIQVSRHLTYLDVSRTMIETFPKCITKLYKLRTLKCSRCLEELPEDLQNLFNLQYLDVSGSKIRSLPRSTTCLYNLRTLRFLKCYSLEEFPDGAEKLTSLQHIYFDDPKLTPANIGQLTSLQTLPLFRVGTEEGRRIEELGGLGQLSGELRLVGLEQVKDREEAMRASLKGKPHLRRLKFEWAWRSDDEVNNDEEVLAGLQPHSNIEKLEIKNFRGQKFPFWYSDLNAPSKLSEIIIRYSEIRYFPRRLQECKSLRLLRISGCDELRSIPDWLKELTSLTDLEISHCRSLGYFPGGSLSHLTNLEKLRIRGFSGELEEFPFSAGITSSLTRVDLHGWRGLKSLPPQIEHLTTLQKLDIRNFDRIEAVPEWLGSLSSLRSLIIENCRTLKYLPSVEAMQHLKYLRISSCRLLEKTCKEGAVEWPKISQIPHANVNYRNFKYGTRI